MYICVIKRKDTTRADRRIERKVRRGKEGKITTVEETSYQ